MKQSIKNLSMAALVVLGTILSSCEKVEIEQPEVNKDNIVVCTTTVSFDAATKALTEHGVKTFAEGDAIAIIYKNTSSETVKAVSSQLLSGSYGNTATFTVSLTNPASDAAVRIIYPAAMAATTVATDAAVDAEATINYAALGTQDGTLATLSSTLDLAVYDGTLEGTDLPANPALKNKLTLCKYTLKDATGSNDITGTVSFLLVEDGTNRYYVSRTPAAGPIYVAIRPTVSATINDTAKTSTAWQVKTVTDKTYEENNLYPLGLRMTALPEGTVPGKFTVANGKQVRFAKGNLQAVFASAGSSCTWQFAEDQWGYIGGRKQNGQEALTGNNLIVGDGTVSAAGTVDLFGWVGASSNWTDAPTIYGISHEVEFNTTRTYGDGYNEYLKSDWGTLAITNGGNTANSGWRTLTIDEWTYLFETRAASTVNGYENARFVKAVVNNIKGMILFPDTYTHPDGVTAPEYVNMKAHDFIENNYSSDDWSKMESAGCVFLPAAGTGNKHFSSVDNAGKVGYYWCGGKSRSASSAYSVVFNYFQLNLTGDDQYRSYAYSVRLAKNVN